MRASKNIVNYHMRTSLQYHLEIIATHVNQVLIPLLTFQKIFENLNFHEISRLRSVCKTWADVGAKILEKRRRLHYLTIHPHDIPTTEGKVSCLS